MDRVITNAHYQFYLSKQQIPNLMHKPEMRRSAYLISTLPRNNRKNSITDSLSLYSSTASTLKAEPTAVDSPNATTLRVGTTSSSSALSVQQQPNCQPSSPSAIDDAQSVTLSIVPPSTPGLEHLESVRKHFHIRTMYKILHSESSSAAAYRHSICCTLQVTV